MDRRDAQRAVPVDVRAGRAESCAAVPRRRARRRDEARRRRQGRRARPAGHRISAATTWRRCWTAYAECDAVTDRPSVVFAYTVKGWGLPIAGNPRNHSALLTAEQVDGVRAAHGSDRRDRVGPLDPATPAGHLCSQRRRRRCVAAAARARLDVTVPDEHRTFGSRKPLSTQEAFGRVLVDLSRDRRWRRTSSRPRPDVATSTNLAGFINRTGSSPRPSGAPGARTRCCAGPRARPGSTSSWASRR